MHVVATAGHVDHGKSALVKALTGIDPDRLKEEQTRQMTIDLGFAWATLPDGDTIGIIDVPGHEDFIENMLSGVGGIDAFLLVVAADEGPMPQTVEHAEILGLLHVASGVVALTKVDLVAEADWLELVRRETAELLAAAGLAMLSQVPVSSVTGEGLDALKAELARTLSMAPERPDLGRPRLAVDRVFSMEGFGTVATGTLIDGTLRVGQEIELAPRGRRARIRGLQTHGESLSSAQPGRRLAVNLSGVEASQVRRGDVLVTPESYPASSRIDVRLEVLPSAGADVRHGDTLKVFHGTARRMARLRLLEADRLLPGERAWAQLELDAPLVASPRDRLILRRPSPPRTIAGAQIADMQPVRRHRRRDSGLLTALNRSLSADAADRALATADRLGIAQPAEIQSASGLTEEGCAAAIGLLLSEGKLLRVTSPAPEGSLMSSSTYIRVLHSTEKALADYRARFPLRPGMPKEELRSKVGIEASLFLAVLEISERQGVLERDGMRVRLTHSAPELSGAEKELLDQFHRSITVERYSPMSVKEARALLGDELYQFEVERGSIVQVSPDVFFAVSTYQEMLDRLRHASGAGITVAEVRDMFGTSRKYALALMEHLDAVGVTLREGDVRRFKTSPPDAES